MTGLHARMPVVRKYVNFFICSRCGNEWPPRKLTDDNNSLLPKTCPACHSPYWNEPIKQLDKSAAVKAKWANRRRNSDKPTIGYRYGGPVEEAEHMEKSSEVQPKNCIARLINIVVVEESESSKSLISFMFAV